MIGPDTAGIGDSLKAACAVRARNPALVIKACDQAVAGSCADSVDSPNAWIRKPKGDDKATSDRRFADPAWTENPYFHAVLLAYLRRSATSRDHHRLGIGCSIAKHAAKA